MTDEKNPYADILDLLHPVSGKHPPMSMMNRAAQFSPFAALTGFDGVIAETGRLTERRIELSETEKEEIDRVLQRVGQILREGEHPEITIRYFVPDELKEGGAFREITGQVRNIDPVERTVIFLAENGRSKGQTVRVDDICEII